MRVITNIECPRKIKAKYHISLSYAPGWEHLLHIHLVAIKSRSYKGKTSKSTNIKPLIINFNQSGTLRYLGPRVAENTKHSYVSDVLRLSRYLMFIR